MAVNGLQSWFVYILRTRYYKQTRCDATHGGPERRSAVAASVAAVLILVTSLVMFSAISLAVDVEVVAVVIARNVVLIYVTIWNLA